MMWKVQLFKLNFDDRERDAVASVVESGWLTMGEQIATFEHKFTEFLGGTVKSAAVSNATAALHMALLAVGVKPNDEVIIPALTFVADANVVKLVGAKPILADSTSLNDWNISAETISKKITDRTKAVIVVHYAGFPCEMAPIVALCKEKGIALIEDAAHSPGASIDGQMCGSIGDVGCFSFFSNKNLSIGEGGMVVSKDPEIAQSLRYLRSHGMTTLTLDRHKGRAITYDVAIPGLNYRMDEMRAALGLIQLEKLQGGNERRKEISDRYRSNLVDSKIEMPFANLPETHVSAYHILPVLLPESVDRIAVIEHLKASGIQSSIHYPPFWGFTAYQGDFHEEEYPIVSTICHRELTLPLYPGMTDDEVDLVTDALKKAVL